MEPQPVDHVFRQPPEKQGSESNPKSGESDQKEQPGLQKRIPARKRARREAPFIMDVEQIMIPSNLYQPWLQNSADIRSSRPKDIERDNTKSARKISKLMDLPPVAVCCGLVGRNNEIHYPKPLLLQWLASMQQPHDSPSGRSASPLPPEPSSSSPPSGQGYQNPHVREILRDGFASTRLFPRENIMDNQPAGNELPNSILNAMFPSAGRNNPMVSAHDSGASLRSLSLGSPNSGHQVFSNNSDNNSGRNNKKRPSTRLTGTGLESVDEDSQLIHDAGELNLAQTELGSKKPRPPQYGLTSEHASLILQETTQQDCQEEI